MRFLVWLSGAKQSVLDQCPSERPKFVGLGGTVLTTAVMATVSCAFALRMAMHLPFAACAIAGLAWGIAILNLDRFLVASTQRQDSALRNLVVVLPRVLLAVLIGFVIAEPLVLRIFNREISAEQAVILRARQATFDADLARDPRFRDLPAQRARIAELEPIASGASTVDVQHDPEVARLRDQLNARQTDFRAAEAAVIGEKDGTSGSGRAGAGPAFREKATARDRLAAEVAQLQQQLAAAEAAARPRFTTAARQQQQDAANELRTLRRAVAAAERSQRAELDRFDRASRDNRGLLARMEALGHLARRQGTLAAALWILRLCILAIDALPVLVKFLLTLGPPSLYDRLVALQEDHDEGCVRDRLDAERDANRIVVDVPREAAELRRQLELESQTRVLRKIVEAQERVASAAVDEWEAQERANVVVSLGDYVQTLHDDAQSKAS
jgi:hypothetical protein